LRRLLISRRHSGGMDFESLYHLARCLQNTFGWIDYLALAV
jgi:hypothetical protein